MQSDHTSKVRLVYDAFVQGDSETFGAFFDPNVEWTSAENFIYADHSPYVGLEAVRRLIFVRLRADWEEFSITPGEIVGGGDIVIASGRFRGKFRATGASVDAQFVQVFQFRHGKIARCQMYTDTAQFKEAVTASGASTRGVRTDTIHPG
jgi:uncharacterized protein